MIRFTKLHLLSGLLSILFSAGFSQREFKGKLLLTDDLTGTALNSISPGPVSPGTFDITFSVNIYSPDFEYADRIEITVPTGWTINSVNNVPENTSCGCVTTEGITGQLAWWQIDETMPSGFGSWYGLTDFVANVTVPDCSGSPWDINWTVTGDGFGVDPHTVSGTYSLACDANPPTYVPLTATVFCQTYSDSFSEGSNVTFELNLLASQSYHFSLCLNDLCCGGEYTGDSDGDLTMYDAGLGMVWYIDGEEACGYDASTKPDNPNGWSPVSDGTYYLMVDDFGAGASSAFTLAYQIASTILTPTATCQTVAGSFGPGGGVYYEMYLTTANDYNFSTCATDPCAGNADEDTDFRMYDASGNELWYVDGSGSCLYHASTFGQSPENWTPAVDGCYYLYVDEFGNGGSTVTYTLAYLSSEIFVLQNDFCDDAITVSCGSSTTGTTTDATFDNAGTCGISNTEPGVWYKFTGTGSMVSAGLCTGTNWDSKISVFGGTCSSLVCVDGNDDYCNYQSRIDWYAENAIDYYILIHQYSTVGGAFTLTIDCTSPATATWEGDDSPNNDWFGADNWDVQDVPGIMTDVIIPAGLNYYPTIDRSAFCNNISFGSDASGAATLLDGGYLTIDGIAEVERFYTGDPASAQDWHLVSSPVSGATASVFMDMYLQNFTEATHSFSEISDPAVILNIMEGYALYSTLSTTNTATFTGDLNLGIQSRNFTADDPDPDPDLTGWNLLGNPYVSSINWETVSIPFGLSNEVHYIEAITGNDLSYVQGVGGFGSQYIPPMQGFFVKATTAGTFSVGNAQRTHSGAGNFYKTNNTRLLILEASGENFTDQAWIHFNNLAGVEHDGVYDAYKRINISNPELPQIYSLTPSGSKLSINGMPETTFVPVGFIAAIPSEFTITAIETGDFTEVMLEDLLTGVKTDLLKESYSFSFNLNEPENRFIVHFTPLAVTENFADQINIYSIHNDVYVSVPANTNGDIAVYNLMGQEVAHTAINDELSKITLNRSAYYVVEVVSDESVVTKKVFVK